MAIFVGEQEVFCGSRCIFCRTMQHHSQYISPGVFGGRYTRPQALPNTPVHNQLEYLQACWFLPAF